MTTKAKLKNWWYYHRIHVLIAAAALAVVVYSLVPNMFSAKADYTLAVVGTVPQPEETLTALREALTPLADDLNGDGRVLVEVCSYVLDLSGQTPGTLNYQGAAAFDADLVGRRSALFLADDAEGFRANVVVPVEELIPCGSIPVFAALTPGYVFTVRSDSDAIPFYRAITQGAGVPAP